MVIEQLMEHWRCETHSLPDKPALCWTLIEQRPHGNCYPITQSNINFWASCDVSCFHSRTRTTNQYKLIALGPRPYCILNHKKAPTIKPFKQYDSTSSHQRQSEQHPAATYHTHAIWILPITPYVLSQSHGAPMAQFPTTFLVMMGRLFFHLHINLMSKVIAPLIS